MIGLCGKEWKIKVVWADLPADYPICRDCVDNAIKALDQADDVIEFARVRADVVSRMMTRLHEELHPDVLLLDVITETDQAHADEVALRKAEKATRRKAKHTCTCTWTKTKSEKPGTAVRAEVDPGCPIHGSVSPDDKPNEVTGE